MPNALSPWVEVGMQDGLVFVQTHDFELYDFLEDYFAERVGLETWYRVLEPTFTSPAQHQLLFPGGVSLPVVESALSAIDPVEVQRIVRLNAS
jgi:hypothetical protein